MTKRFRLVAGNIGAGKTTPADRLATRLGWEAGYESVERNPLLGDRAEQHRKLASGTRSASIDRTIYEDAHIFA